jgi:uncharacterized membrane protein (UPF0127 family)
MLLSRSEATRAQGLMHVRPGALAPYAGMVFAFDEDVTGSFTMSNTVMPLDIVFLDASGGVVSSRLMTPCRPGRLDCPTYPASRPYRSAIEVPAGHLAPLGLDVRAKVSVGGSCPS